MSVAILVPVLGRPHRVLPTIVNVARTTKAPYRLLFIASEGDVEEIAALEREGADFLVVGKDRISFACKVNDGLNATSEEWTFTGADDLRFHPGWFERALAWADEQTGVIGTNDIANPRVMTGAHSTHSLFRRSYVEDFGTIDQPGKVFHEGYRHDFTDDEAIATAKARGVYVHAFDAIVEHLHPMVGKAPDDPTYKLGRKWSADGRRLFAKRKALWADEALVRSQMVPAPDRAVVVTATYGRYDSELHVPVAQDMPVEFVCFTDQEELEVPEPWQVRVVPGVFGDDSRMSAKVPKMMPEVGCDDVVWLDASHEIVSPSFVREALAARHDGIAAFKHPRRECVYDELAALLGPENQNGLYFNRPLVEQGEAYRAEGHPPKAGLFACGTLAWDLSHPKAEALGQAWLDETEKWSHQDQVEFPVVCRRLGIEPGTFPVAQIDAKLSRGKRYLSNRWFNIHPHVIPEPALPVSVLIPFSSDDPDRRAALQFVVRRYQSLGWEVCQGAADGPWSKGKALDAAFRLATNDILVIADADCVLDETTLKQAVGYIQAGASWVVPHRRTWRLDKSATARALRGGQLRPSGPVHQAVVGGGIVVLTREAWETVGGIDPRFVQWGGDDISFGWALETLVGPGVFGQGRLMHLWHGIDSPRKGSPESEALAGRYRRARGDEQAMRELVDEARALA